MNRTRSLKRNLTHRQCSRLATHFQERLEKLGIDWKPSGMPLIPPIEVIAFEKWDDETGMPDLLGNLRVTPHVHQIIDKRSLETAGLVRLKSNEVFCSISFDHVRICGAPLPYSRLFRVAIHEGAHVIYWLEQISRTGNKFSEAD